MFPGGFITDFNWSQSVQLFCVFFSKKKNKNKTKQNKKARKQTNKK